MRLGRVDYLAGVLGIQEHLVGIDRPVDVLDGLRAEKCEAHIDVLFHLVEDAAGDADTARFGQSLQTGRDVDAVAVDILLVDHHVAQVDPNAEGEALALWLVLGPFRHAALDGD